MAGVIQIPWYATGFRGDSLEEALARIAPVALRYGATDYRLYRSRDDRYQFTQMATFAEKRAFTAYWEGPEFTEFRVLQSGSYQIPVLYGWTDLVVCGGLSPEVIAGGHAGTSVAAG